MAERPVGLVLAAGSSTRLGRNKLLLEVGGESLVRRAVRVAGSAELEPVLVVLGYEAELVSRELRGLSCTTVENPRHSMGVGTSLREGVRRAVSLGAASLVLLLADMPFVTREMILALSALSQGSGARLVVSHYGAVQAPPTLFAASLFPELMATGDEAGARSVVMRHQGEAAVVSWPEDALRDVDTEEDFGALRGAFADSSTPMFPRESEPSPRGTAGSPVGTARRSRR